jgi:mRNA interferase YafQ
MYALSYTNRFEKDLKLVKKRSIKDFNLCLQFLKHELSRKGAAGLPRKYKAHKLTGNYKDNWECHIKPDLLVIWIEVTDDMEIKLVRLGTHSDLF